MFCFVWLQALLKEQEQSLNWLGQLKDYDEKLAQELAAKALQEQKNQKLEVNFFFSRWFLALENLNKQNNF